MNKISAAFKVIGSNIYIVLLKLCGKKVRCNAISLVSFRATFITKGKHSQIGLGYKSGISPNTVLSATNGKIEFGDCCFINRNCMVVAHEKIEVGNNVTIGPGTYIYDHDHDGEGGYNTKPIVIGDNVWIGAGCIILKGVSIGNNSTIGAGTIIADNVPENSVVYQKRDTTIKTKE